MGDTLFALIEKSFWVGKRVFITGHTGFKGGWLCHVLKGLGADVVGYGLAPPSGDNLFELARIENGMKSIIGDIRDINSLKVSFEAAQPEIVFHLAAQPIVRESYSTPRYTYETNVMGTVNVLECIRETASVKSFLNVTTDKVYRNNEWVWGYRENEWLDGFDPYSNSKSCSELVTHCYSRSFFYNRAIGISTARAGNVIGGGDFAKDRIIPDCIRAQEFGETIIVRNPNSIRPYQHVIEPIMAYTMIAEHQYKETCYAGWYNIGPDDCDCITTGELATLFCNNWGDNAQWVKNVDEDAPHEANFLKLDCTKLKKTFNWHPRLHIEDAVKMTVEWAHVKLIKKDVCECMDKQISSYLYNQ
jgi:CDP-glucose 4,6-dehydratase